MDKYYTLDSTSHLKLKKIAGPIMIFGAGGFIGMNMLKTMLAYRQDVYGISQDYKKNWRFMTGNIPRRNLRNCDLNELAQITSLIRNIKPKTIFNMAAYGAYSKQKEYGKIYRTNIISTSDLIEILKETGFNVYIHAGSQSEYGTNSKGPQEDSELSPNSHYAVSKTANYFTMKYYGKTEKLPVVHMRLYSAYGPWEEPDRLVPVLLSKARKGILPQLVNPNVSRDFIYVQDIVDAFITVAAKISPNIYGEAFNIATGKKTTIKNLVEITKKMLKFSAKPEFGSMKNRDWDLEEWYGNPEKMQRVFNWRPKYSLEDGLMLSVEWQKDIDYDSAIWSQNSRL